MQEAQSEIAWHLSTDKDELTGSERRRIIEAIMEGQIAGIVENRKPLNQQEILSLLNRMDGSIMAKLPESES